MKRFRHLYLFIATAVVALLCGCDATIHEYPEEEKPATPLTLRFVFNDSLPQYKTIETGMSRSATRAERLCERRFIVRAFRTDGGYSGTRTADYTFLYTLPDVGTDSIYEVHPDLPAGSWRFMVWEDYSALGTGEGTYYNADSFEEIVLVRDAGAAHQGNTDRRDAFRGVKDTVLTRLSAEVCTIEMQRPLAKYEFVTTDLDEFLTRALQQAAQRSGQTAGGSGGTAKTPSADAGARSGMDQSALTDTRGINLEDYRVVFSYPLYMPCSYNMFTDRPADSWAAVTFEGSITRLSSTEARLGFDYVFVNGTEAMVTVAVAIYNKENVQVAAVDAITVPLRRSRLTTVRGKFLTASAGGAVSIDPGFDGEYNIRIN